jgi:hypothetical protein
VDMGSNKCANIMLDVVHRLGIFHVHFVLGVVRIPIELLFMVFKR